MATPSLTSSVPALSTIPLLDLSNLPAADDWALLESIQSDGVDFEGDLEADFDRFGRFRVVASLDE